MFGPGFQYKPVEEPEAEEKTAPEPADKVSRYCVEQFQKFGFTEAESFALVWKGVSQSSYRELLRKGFSRNAALDLLLPDD